MHRSPPRHGKIFIVEDNYLLAELVSDLPHDWGIEPVGPVGRLHPGCQLAEECEIDGAILDVKLCEDLVFPICAILKARKVPFILLAGTPAQASLIPHDFGEAPLVKKPFEDDELKAALKLILLLPDRGSASADAVA